MESERGWAGGGDRGRRGQCWGEASIPRRQRSQLRDTGLLRALASGPLVPSTRAWGQVLKEGGDLTARPDGLRQKLPQRKGTRKGRPLGARGGLAPGATVQPGCLPGK